MLLVAAGVAHAELGVVFSLWRLDFIPGNETYSCMRRSGYQSVIVNLIDPCTGNLIAGALETMQHAKRAELQAEAFLNPCMPCMNGTAQAEATWKGVSQAADFFWVGEYSGCANPSNNFEWNHEFVTSIVTALEGFGAKVGINAETWGYIMGNWDGLSKYPVWYGGNSNPSFSDFQPFSGWTKPALKTYSTGTLCNITVDFTYRP